MKQFFFKLKLSLLTSALASALASALLSALFICAQPTAAIAADFVMHKPSQAIPQLPATVKNETKVAQERGLKPFVLMYADWCSPCHAIKKHIKNPLMQDAFKGTYIILINVDEWSDEIKGKYFVRGIPTFFEINSAGEPSGKKIDSGAWEDNTPSEMAPVLNKFFHSQKLK